MRILQISTYDIRGGAARATHRLHRGLCELGEDCRMLVRHKDSNDPSISCVIPENQPEKVDEEFFLSVAIQEHYINSHRTDISNTLFSLPYPGYDLSTLPMVQEADIINLHWVANYQSQLTLHKLFALGKPVVWTLHDQWAFTGGCHYTAGCEEYCHGCAVCPQLADDPFNLSGAILKDKLRLFENANLTVVTPSRWMGACAKESKLFKDLRIEVIPNALETDVFRPLPKAEAKKSIGLTPDIVTLLFGGEYGNEKRKGFHELIRAIEYCLKDDDFANLIKARKIRLICFGYASDELEAVGIPVEALGYLDSDEKIMTAYCAADIFVLPSLEDNLPNTMLEAMSCGTPVIAFDVGGMPDAVINGVTGQLVPMGDTRQMGKAILSLIFNSEKRGGMGKKCREKIEEQYKLEIQAQRYLDLYQELFEPYASTAQATSEDHTSRVWEVPVSLKGEPLSVILEPGVGFHFKDIYDQVLLKALKELSCYVQKQWQASEADRAERLKVIEQLGKKLEASESDRVASELDRAARLKDMDKLAKQLKASELDRAALVEFIQAHEKIFTGSLVGLLRYRRATKKRMNTQRKNDASPRQWADPQRLGVFTAEAKSAKEDESFAVSVPGASSSQEIKDMSMKASGEKLPLISIVVPSFNQGRFLREALDSIFRQNYPHLEVIVMDGGSMDESVDIIRSYENRLTYWQSKPDKGQTAAINEGVGRCTGELVAWLNSDDFYWKDSLWTVGRAYAAYPERGLYIGNGLRYNQGEDIYTPFCSRHLALNRDALINGIDYILQPASFFLRRAWQEVGGLKPELDYCMDWDIIIRVAARYPAVLINEFLAVSREYEETKTSKGALERAFEIALMVQSHTGREVTPGSLFYLLENLLGVIEGPSLSKLRDHFVQGIDIIRDRWAPQYGNSDGFPEAGDPQDSTYLPFARNGSGSQSGSSDFSTLPSISVITPSFNQARFLEQTLESIFRQNYPRLQTIVIDGGSNDGSVDILRRYDDRLSYWVSEADKGPAHAINKGFSEAKGEIVAWLNADDMYADEALWEAGKAFAEDPELDMIFANALYIDEKNRLFLADHGTYRTGLYYGEIQPKERIPAYWRYIHALPQPTVFFRRSLLDSCGNLDEKYQFIFDFELFFRFVGTAKIKKIERTMAFYRIHSAAKTSEWSNFEVELYRFSRKLWPRLRDSEFWFVHRDFVANFMRRNFNWLPRGFRFWSVAAIVSLFAATRLGNPEKLKRYFSPPPPPQNPVLTPRSLIMQPSIDQSARFAGSGFAPASQAHNITINRKSQRYHTVFCSYTWPRHPGYSGGEIRDFQLVRHLLKMSAVEFFALYDYLSDGRDDLLLPFVDKLHTPNAARPDLVHQQSLRLRLKHRLLSNLRLRNVPVFGPRYHNDAALRFHMISAYTLATLNERLSQKPDFLFVSPQSNPVAMMLNVPGIDTRLIMASYDVEAVRMRRFAASQSGMAKVALALEARRAEHFEKENLAFYDGIIAVSDLDKDIFVNEYGFPPERVVVIDNGVDPGYFAFNERQPVERPEIVYTGSFSYLPNQQAAWRLIRGIMPIVWKKYPEARLWIVGQQPGPKLEAQSDGKRIVVTGRVEDIRPYLAGASAGCVPLSAGSGTKYKVLEALSAGMPLVCTPLSIEGLELEDEKHLLLGDDDEELAAALMRLLEQPDLVKEITGQGNDWVKQRYAWDTILPRMDSWLDTLAAMPRRQNGSGGGST